MSENPRNEPVSDSNPNPKDPPQLRKVADGVANTKTGKSSAIMAAGTLVSRVLGFVRQWLLVVAIGGFGIADSFNTANILPNTLYNLLAGGILNAILVPTIVRALANNNGKEGVDRVNALLTLASIALLGLTVLSVALAWPLVMLFAGGMQPKLFNLTVIFALWCLPQIFFYGTYALLGQVLNSLSSFGPYMWSPVVNNLVGIAGLGVFINFYGTAPSHDFDVSRWDAPRIALLAGSMTLGIALQAIILVFPLMHLGFRLRANFHWHGLGFRHTGRVAAWAFAGLLANTCMNLIVARIASAANGAGQLDGNFYPGFAIYQYANTLYMLPQSLVTISVTTAVFTSMALHATRDDIPALAGDYLHAARLSSLFNFLLAGMLIVGALPLANVTATALPPQQAQALAVILTILSLGIPAQVIFSTTSRALYSLEDTRAQFFLMLFFPFVTAILGLIAYFMLSPFFWVPVTTAAEPVSLTASAVLGLVLLHRRGFSHSVFQEIFGHYLRLLVATVVAGIPAWVLLTFVIPTPGADWSYGATFVSGAWRCLVVALVMAPLYFGMLWIFRVREVRGFLTKLRR
ncbi:murein biosynthesis integral membrane protein MurJ [uncultured Mobiluncus sp.]|uniref:murein biosynthesis integral membrane protein MurJ n=1 Tax=uncultured Mobiluncus sp. TaxID=293425 RepID=UPI00261683C4|nr:lipid II flippase MurJ [uncultured Mobiluncus sp.]